MHNNAHKWGGCDESRAIIARRNANGNSRSNGNGNNGHKGPNHDETNYVLFLQFQEFMKSNQASIALASAKSEGNATTNGMFADSSC